MACCLGDGVMVLGAEEGDLDDSGMPASLDLFSVLFYEFL